MENQIYRPNLRGFEVGRQQEKIRALLVEDDAYMQDIWKLIFGHVDREVELHWVVSALAAQKILADKSKLFDIVVSDIFLSGDETGIHLWRRLKPHGPTFIFCSAISEASFKKQFSEGEAIPDFVPKPIHIPRTVAIIKRTLENRADLANGLTWSVKPDGLT